MISKLNHTKEAAAVHLPSILERGLFYHQQGDLEQAEKNYRKILNITPLNAEALHLLGVLSNQKQHNTAAIDLIRRAIQIFPNQPIYHNNLGNAYRDSDRYEDAILCYQKALQLKPDIVEIHINMGIAYHQLADLDRAVSAYQKAIALKPDSPEAYYNLGNTFKEQRLFDEAISCFQRAVAIKPIFIEAYFNLASSLEQRSRTDEAIECLKQCLRINPQMAEAHNNLGNLFKYKGMYDQALSCYQKAVQTKPELYEAHNNLGNAYKDQGRFTEAIACYQKALKRHVGYAEAYLNLGVIFAEFELSAEAIDCFQKATRINPKFAEAFNFMGMTLADTGRRDAAIECFEKAITVNPSYAEAYSYLIHQLQYACNWRQLETYSHRLEQLILQKNAPNDPMMAEPPFIDMARHSDLSQHLVNARAWCRKTLQPFQNLRLPFHFESRRQKNSKMTIGYLSCDFHDHATAHLVQRVFGLHDRDKFIINCYSYGPDDQSLYREEIQKQSDQFVHIRELSHMDAAKRIFADGVDILVDLKGHTKGARLGILACRPAPIQVHYLGYPGTTGADFIDYLITDNTVTPIEHAHFYSEKLVFLPHSYQINDYQQEIETGSWQKEELGLPRNSFVFSSFNLPYKIDPNMFDCWMRIMNQVPRSVLWLFNGGETTTNNLKQEARSRGIDPRQLVFGDRLPKAQHLARLQLADLALDTRIVNGHTTTSDSLWAGVPVVTLRGGHFASRVSASLLKAIGLPELIVDDLDAFERLVVRLATQPDELGKLKDKLMRNRLKDPLFDTPRFVRNLEDAYHKMWQIFQAGRAPEQIEVVEAE